MLEVISPTRNIPRSKKIRAEYQVHVVLQEPRDGVADKAVSANSTARPT